MSSQDLLHTLALTRISHLNLTTALELYRRLGSGAAIYEHRNDIADILPNCSPKLVSALRDWSEPLHRAEVEMDYCQLNNISILCLGDPLYPERLTECPDAPIVLFYKGNADLNQKKVLSIVGTRRSTKYGADVIHRFVSDLKALCPKVLVVSGLAYGIDILAHREALACGLETVAVLAHGLDTLYPTAHRATANEMVSHGGLLTEYMTGTNADKPNFIRRNRIVAGVSDACILVESSARGGGLITARISQSYYRDVFAVPGRIGDEHSEGCNNLIRDNGATLLSSAEHFAKAMGWDDEPLRNEALTRGIERQFFPDLTPEQTLLADQLKKLGDLPTTVLSTKTGLPIHKVNSLLFELEMAGVVKPLAGGVYHILS